MLVAGGATVNVQDNKGMTPRLLALQAEDHELAAYLESKYFIWYPKGKLIDHKYINTFLEIILAEKKNRKLYEVW